jgi:ABC-type multidrug transport system fused ATPase/permease subunit
LNDDTVTRNVAYGIPDAEIDFERVKKATRLAAIYDFVVNELPEGFETAIGEKGIRLSGGQRQRIGLARALYNNPDVLILDEATSSLDGITEASISKALNQLAGKKTLIIIAHRITTVKRCDMIYFIDKGRIIDRGTYDELMNKSTQFQAMSR